MQRVLGLSILGFIVLLSGLVSHAQETDTSGQSVGTATITGGGTINFIPIWTGASTLGNSVLFQKSGNIGIGTTNPLANFKLDVNGGVHVRGSVGVTGNLAVVGTLFAGSSLTVLDALTVQGNITDPCFGYTSANVIGGYNTAVFSGVTGATIAGGGTSGSDRNLVTDDFGTVGGGAGNVAGDSSGTTCDAVWATVAGGSGNTASGGVSTVAGGNNNTASGATSFVAGGNHNTASGITSFVAGNYNRASGGFSTVAGGTDNMASGDFSFAAGHGANATDYGSFLWCQTNGNPCGSLGTNSFEVSVYGPIYFYDGPGGAGRNLSSGGGSWNCSSDRNLKEDITAIDSRSVLEQVAQLPITQWKMKAEPAGRKHIGPMAQDFYAAFALGDDDRYIGQGDAQGVALAAIQALYKVVQEKEHQIEQLQRRLERVEAAQKHEAP
jgi:hypothetical protein